MTERWYPEVLDDLRAFIASGHGEDHYREFKVALPPNDQRTRFLNDVLLRGAKRMEHSMAAGSRHYWDFLSAPEMIEITPGPRWRFGRRDTRIVCDARVENDGAFVYRSNRAGGEPPESLLVLENIAGGRGTSRSTYRERRA